MKVENAVVPNEEQIQGFTEDPETGPIYLINLLKYKDSAAYEDGRETDLSGEEAYAIYAQEVLGHLAKAGGKLVFGAGVRRLMLGSVEELWDHVAIAMYPNRKAMLTMIMDPDYQASAVHRTAGLAGQLNIETLGAGMFVEPPSDQRVLLSRAT